MKTYVTEKTVAALASGMGLIVDPSRISGMTESLNRQIDGFSVLVCTDNTVTPIFDNAGGDKYKVQKDA